LDGNPIWCKNESAFLLMQMWEFSLRPAIMFWIAGRYVFLSFYYSAGSFEKPFENYLHVLAGVNNCLDNEMLIFEAEKSYLFFCL
jgi:hypothetical protein